MTRRLLAIASFSAPLLLVGCFGGGGGDDEPPPAVDECQLNSQGEQTPGYPFNPQKFRTEALPVLIQSCGTGSGCHGNPVGQGGFTVWADAASDDCNFGKSFNQTAAKIDLSNPANSRLLQAPSGGSTTHPPVLAATTPGYATLKAYVDDGAATFAAGGGGVTPPVGDANPHDPTVFANVIQPILDSNNCSSAGCHGAGAGGFSLKANATGADLTANFAAVTQRNDLKVPDKSRIYVKGLTPHSGSTKISAADAKKILDWVTEASKKAPPGGGGGGGGCAPINLFNLGVFTSEIIPILNGSVDYNEDDQQGNGAGCMSVACHGQSRGPGTLALIAADDPAVTLQNFVCFVDLTNPSNSEILTCPSEGPCRVGNHPGQDVLDGADDLNYQRILAFLFGAKADISPHDFAFFVRKINPIFNDINAVEAGAQGRTCSDTGACHGTSVAGQAPPNGSDFPIIPNTTDLGGLTFNFVSTTGFVNFLNPTQSSLFLYPTNNIADRVNNPLATGLDHPGGDDFADDSAEGLAILQFSAGLRPDGNGQNLNWLVNGDFVGADIQDDPIPFNVKPKIFDETGASFNSGEWDLFASDDEVIDLNLVFQRAVNPGRVAYATVYVVNTDDRDIDAQIVIADTVNPIRAYVDGRQAAVNDQGGGVTIPALLKASNKKMGPTQITLKIEQRQNDATFQFSAQFFDEDGNELTDDSGELVFTTGPNGGI
jgi:hypothetical protein